MRAKTTGRARLTGRGAALAAKLAILALAGGALAQDAPAIPPEALGVSQAVTAAELAAWGRARSDPGALIMAARLLGEMPVRAGAGGDSAPFLTPDSLLDEAEVLAAGHPSWLAAIAQVRDGVRGVRSSPFGQGPIVTVKEIRARETWGFDVEARGGEVLRIAAIGDGDTNIDLRIRDSRGALVCEDGFGDHYPVCTVPAREDGRMRVDIVNRGEVWTKVQILSN